MKKIFVVILLVCILAIVLAIWCADDRDEFYETKGQIENVHSEAKDKLIDLCCDLLEKETGEQIEDSFIKFSAVRTSFHLETYFRIHVLYQDGTLKKYFLQVEGLDEEILFNELRLGNEKYLSKGFFENKSAVMDDDTIIIH